MVSKNLAFALIVAAVMPLCAAQTVLKSEPLVLAPYETAFVEKASCPAKVLKVTGAIRGLDRKGFASSFPTNRLRPRRRLRIA